MGKVVVDKVVFKALRSYEIEAVVLREISRAGGPVVCLPLPVDNMILPWAYLVVDEFSWVEDDCWNGTVFYWDDGWGKKSHEKSI